MARLPGPPDAGVSRPGAASRRRVAARDLSPARLRRRGAGASGGARRGRGGRCFRAPGRGLRRELRGVPPGQHPRHLPGAPADGGGPDLRRRVPGGEDRASRGPVREAALRTRRDLRRRGAPLVPRRHRERHRVRLGRADARPRADAARLPPVRVHAEPSPGAGAGRVRGPAPRTPVEPRVRLRDAPGGALPRARRSDPGDARLHGGVRRHRRHDPRGAPDRVLHLARGAAARLRAGAHAHRLHHRRLVRQLRAPALDRRPHAPAGTEQAVEDDGRLALAAHRGSECEWHLRSGFARSPFDGAVRSHLLVRCGDACARVAADAGTPDIRGGSTADRCGIRFPAPPPSATCVWSARGEIRGSTSRGAARTGR